MVKRPEKYEQPQMTYVTRKMARRIAEEAGREGRKVADMIRVLLREALAARDAADVLIGADAK
jgi:hypothetical protein